jgi:hypothetical protein
MGPRLTVSGAEIRPQSVRPGTQTPSHPAAA